MTLLAITVRALQLASGLALVGVFTFSLLAGRSDRPTARVLETRLTRLARWLVVLVVSSGVGALACQAAVVSGRASALAEPVSWLALLTQSRFGSVWLARHALLLVLTALVLLREHELTAADWAAWRIEGAVLAGAAAGLIAWAGHAAAIEPGGLAAIVGDTIHVLAAGVWVGALLPLAWLLRAGSTEAGADVRPLAVLAVRRFSTLALASMVVIAATGLWAAWLQVGGMPALVGTRYGALLSVKIAVVIAIVAIAAVNRRRLLPALSGPAATVGRPAMSRLARAVAAEGVLALIVLALTSTLGVVTPARHDAPYWPFAHRISYDAVAGLPGVKPRLLVGSQVALLGILAMAAGILVRTRRVLLIGAGVAAFVFGLSVALPPLAVDAYPTTYLRPSVPYQAESIASGLALYRAHCAICHGPGARGDGSGGAGLPRPPADLTAAHTGQHTAGDLFWWITHGIPGSGMPAFGSALDEEERWDLINFVRALAAAAQAPTLTPALGPVRPWLVAPDFGFAVGPAPSRTLKEFRGRAAVLLVLFTLPESRARLARLAEIYPALQVLGTEVIAVPADADPRVLARLGGDPPILYPVATEGAQAIASSYALFARRPAEDRGRLDPAVHHMELIIDRQGYIRARWLPGAGPNGWGDPAVLRGALETLAREAPAAIAPDEHVH